jgi:hypothetical protein
MDYKTSASTTGTRNALCKCGSGKRYKHCCGLISKSDKHNSNCAPVVVIPVHRPTLNNFELISLTQCAKVFSAHKIRLVAPLYLDLTQYREIIRGADVVRVESQHMESRSAYNKLMLSPRIVDELDSFSHMLIHEPDAIVLRDELYKWCLAPYDYIGAPWFEGWGEARIDAPIIGVGNSGFSLLRLDSFRSFSALTRWQARDWRGHCDYFWAFRVPRLEPTFRVAPVAEAVRFAWEVHPRRCMAMAGGNLPFGIHAWFKYDLNFLRPHLEHCGVDFIGS